MGKRASLGERADVLLGAVDERADDDVRPPSATSFGGIDGELPGEDQVQEQRLEDVVAVVAEGDLVAAELLGDAIEDAAAQARAERAVRLSLRGSSR